MRRFTTVDEFFENQTKWKPELEKLRGVLLKLPFEEIIKWGAPTYTINGKNVVGIGAFENHVGLWFFNGSFLKDDQKELQNAQEGTTRGMRQWRFTSAQEMDDLLISTYLKEAIENQKQGKVIKIVKNKKSIEIPSELKMALDQDVKLNVSFEKFTPSKQREFTNYISEAKRETTKVSRLEKIIPMIKSGVGLNDKYRNC